MTSLPPSSGSGAPPSGPSGPQGFDPQGFLQYVSKFFGREIIPISDKPQLQALSGVIEQIANLIPQFKELSRAMNRGITVLERGNLSMKFDDAGKNIQNALANLKIDVEIPSNSSIEEPARFTGLPQAPQEAQLIPFYYIIQSSEEGFTIPGPNEYVLANRFPHIEAFKIFYRKGDKKFFFCVKFSLDDRQWYICNTDFKPEKGPFRTINDLIKNAPVLKGLTPKINRSFASVSVPAAPDSVGSQQRMERGSKRGSTTASPVVSAAPLSPPVPSPTHPEFTPQEAFLSPFQPLVGGESVLGDVFDRNALAEIRQGLGVPRPAPASAERAPETQQTVPEQATEESRRRESETKGSAASATATALPTGPKPLPTTPTLPLDDNYASLYRDFISSAMDAESQLLKTGDFHFRPGNGDESNYLILSYADPLQANFITFEHVFLHKDQDGWCAYTQDWAGAPIKYGEGPTTLDAILKKRGLTH